MRDMKPIVFIDIDTQFDFCLPNGKLYVPGSKDIIHSLRTLTALASKNDILIVSSVDKHIKNDPEFKQFPAHCVEGTKGQKKIAQTLLKSHTFIRPSILNRQEVFDKLKRYKQLILEKNTHDIFTNFNLLRILKPFQTAFVYGVALDYCVKYAVLGLLKLDLSVNLIIDATKPVDAKVGNVLLEEFKRRGVRLLKTKDIAREIQNE